MRSHKTVPRACNCTAGDELSMLLLLPPLPPLPPLPLSVWGRDWEPAVLMHYLTSLEGSVNNNLLRQQSRTCPCPYGTCPVNKERSLLSRVEGCFGGGGGGRVGVENHVLYRCHMWS